MDKSEIQAELQLMRAMRAETNKLLTRRESVFTAYGIFPLCLGMALGALLLYSMGFFNHG